MRKKKKKKSQYKVYNSHNNELPIEITLKWDQEWGQFTLPRLYFFNVVILQFTTNFISQPLVAYEWKSYIMISLPKSVRIHNDAPAHNVNMSYRENDIEFHWFESPVLPLKNTKVLINVSTDLRCFKKCVKRRGSYAALVLSSFCRDNLILKTCHVSL